MSWVPTGLEIKNDCAGEDQQQFTGLDYLYALFVGDGVIVGLDGASDNIQNWKGIRGERKKR
jgi:hypothetical protein